jgi:hypothetical protein
MRHPLTNALAHNATHAGAEHQAHLPGRDTSHDDDKQASSTKQTKRPGQVQRTVRHAGRLRYSSLVIPTSANIPSAHVA